MGKKVLVVFALLSAFFFSKLAMAEDEPEPGPIYMELILDASNSMNEELEGVSKMQTAKGVIASLANTLDPNIQLGLRIYGNNFDPLGTKEKACQDSTLVIGFGADNRAQIVQAVQNAKATGYTPIAYSLSQSPNDFASVSGGKKIIVLVSDGKESCGGDPCAIAKELKSKGLDVVVNPIGFAVDEETKQQLRCIAQATGGQYYDAKDAAALAETFKKIETEAKSLVGEKSEFEYDGKEITAAAGCSGAPALEPGKYVLKDLAVSPSGKLGEIKHCVTVPLKASQSLDFKAMILGVAGPKTQSYDSSNANLSVQAFGTSDQFLHYEHEKIYVINADSAYTVEGGFDTDQDQSYCLSFSGAVNSESSPIGFNAGFELIVTDRFDAESGKDAPASFAEALPIEIKEYSSNYLLINDTDRFKFDVPAGMLTIRILPEETKSLRAALYNEDRENLVESSSKNDGALVKIEKAFDAPQTIYLEVSSNSRGPAWVKGQKDDYAYKGGKYGIKLSVQPAAALKPEA